MLKTIGLAEPLRQALAPLADSIQLALVYGSTAKGADTASSDIDLLIVSDTLALEAVYTALAPAERQIARRISVNLYTAEEFQRRRAEGHSFLTKVLAGEHWLLIGQLDGGGCRYGPR